MSKDGRVVTLYDAADAERGVDANPLRTEATLQDSANVEAGTTANPLGTAPGVGQASTSVVTRVATAVVTGTLLALNTSRIGAALYNNATSNLFIKLGATANIGAGTESYTVRLVPNAYYEIPAGYTGIVDGIWDAADGTGEALITELTS